MSAAIDTLGVVSDVLGIVSFLLSNFPSSEDPQGAKIQIKAGLGNDAGDGSSALGGTVIAAYGWDINNNYLGQSDSCTVEAGDVCTVTIDQDVPGVQSDFVGISNTDDATCISWLSVKQFDGSPGGAWTGDIGYHCGDQWYYGRETAGNKKNGNPYRPRCAWLDGDHTHHIPWASLKFTVRAYGELSDKTLHKHLACKSTLFAHGQGAINGKPAKSGKRSDELVEREEPARLPWMEDRLIISDFEDHTSEGLCNSTTSWGPDFIGSDGMFCDMGSKTLSPLCSISEVDGCVHFDQAASKVYTKRSVARRALAVSKTYGTVSHW